MAFSDKMKSTGKTLDTPWTRGPKAMKETPAEESKESPEMQADEENSMLGILKQILSARTLEESKALAQEAIAAHGAMDSGDNSEEGGDNGQGV